MQTLLRLTRRTSKAIHAYSAKRSCWSLTPLHLQKLVRWPNTTLSPTPCASLADVKVQVVCPCVLCVLCGRINQATDAHTFLSYILGGRHIRRRLLFPTCQVSPYHGCPKLQGFTPGLTAACSPALASRHALPVAAPHNQCDRS